MKVVYYMDRDGKICRHHLAKEEWSDEKTQTLIKEFNAHPELHNGKTAAIEEIKEGTLAEYLLRKADQRMEWDREIVQDALDAIRSAEDCVRGLIYE